MIGTPADIEIWGGIECTHNRVGDRARSQLRLNGHLERIEDDLDAFAALGLSAIRYPVLWEDVEPNPGQRDFAHADRALGHLHTGAMRPIVGLLHHGSGPTFTSLTDPTMPATFADHAGAVARRYPWVTDFTPVNEPLTTARFAGLYGHWYPHARDDRAFVTMLMNQVLATVLAMQAIRAVTPSARLIQTEDLGRAAGTELLMPQVGFENERRWLTFDLLCGLVVPGHDLYDYLVRSGGADPAVLGWLSDNPCPPDLVGINHYPRSNRWLDERIEVYAPADHGSNGRLRYADVAAYGMPGIPVPSLSSLIEETWRRYRLPVAVTEVHLHGDSPARIGWWLHAMAEARAAATSADVRAVTTWSLLGSFDWDTLCTSAHDEVTYEPGVFDVSTGARCATPVAAAVAVTAGERMLRAAA